MSYDMMAIRQDAVDAIARAADGGMRDAQSLLDQMIAFFSGGASREISGEQVLSLFGLTDRSDLLKLLGAMLGNRPGEAVKVISSLKGKGKNLETLFDDLLAALRAVELCGILDDPAELVDESAENLAQYRRLAAQVVPAIPQQLLENLAPAGRMLRDALNKQVLLETIILKAMREAHAVKLDEVLKRLNQLRSAGELKFLDQIPPIAKGAATAPEPPPTPTPEPPPASPPKTDSAPMPEPPSAPREDENVSVAAPNPEPEPTPEPESEPEPVTPPPVVTPPPPPERRVQTSPDGKKRESIANRDPGAIRDAVKNDPQVKELADLFDAAVIDIHRPAGE